MNALNARINLVINKLEPEYRIPVVNALHLSDGTLMSFQEELVSQTWEIPDLPVQDILDLVAFDVA